MSKEELQKWRDERQERGTKGPKGYTTAQNTAWLMGGGSLSHENAKKYLKLVEGLK